MLPQVALVVLSLQCCLSRGEDIEATWVPTHIPTYVHRNDIRGDMDYETAMAGLD